MRIAVSGTHNTGKTTLIDELTDSLPGFTAYDEPYFQLVEEGYEFASIPCLDDFAEQLNRSIETIVNSNGDCLFDRCPYDILAYMINHEDSAAFNVDDWLPELEKAIRLLDFVIYVPIEFSDNLSESDFGTLRQRVDEEIQSMLLYDRWSFGVPCFEVTGSPSERVSQVIQYLY